MRSSALYMVAGATIGATAPLVQAQVAGADPNSCESGEVCLFENYDFNDGNTNHVRQWVGDDSTYTNNTWFNATDGTWSNDGMNDETSSVKNNGTQCSVTLFQNSSYGGAASTFARGTSDGNLSNNAIGDNRASSHRWC